MRLLKLFKEGFVGGASAIVGILGVLTAFALLVAVPAAIVVRLFL